MVALFALAAAASAAVADEAPRWAATQQLILVDSDGWDAPQGRLQRFERPHPGAPFAAVGAPLAVWLGRAGMAWRSDADAPTPPAPGPRKREGDGRSPAGVLKLGELWGYAAQPPAGITLPYHQASERSRCVDDPESPAYGQLLSAPVGQSEPWRSAERLLLPTEHYKYLVVIDYNQRRPQPGAGSCIFLHVAPAPAQPTAGCTALAEADLLLLLRWLSSKTQDKPLPPLVQLPRPVLAAASRALGLPPLPSARQ